MPNDILNPNYFLNWLKLQEPTRTMGEDGIRCHVCPIATFLVEALPFGWSKVGIRYFETGFNAFDFHGTTHKMPQWATEFVDLFDLYARDDTAASAVTIMQKLIDEGV